MAITGKDLARCLRPSAVLAVLAALLATMYLGYIVDPEKNLHDFPVGLVNLDVGDVVGGQQVNVGDQIAASMAQQIPADKVDLRQMGLPELHREMLNGTIYGAVVIPSDFTKRLSILGTASIVPGDVERPVITVETNPAAGAYATQILLRITTQATDAANREVGAQLLDQVQGELQSASDAPATQLSGVSRLGLAEPISVVVVPFRTLPDGAGGGLSAFFYTLLLLLAGFTGAMIIHSMVDSSLGFAPTEYGPWYVHYPPTPISRVRTLLLKWGILVAVAPVVSGIYLAVATLLGMSIQRAPMLFLYGILAIVAVGVTALSILAIFGAAGLLVNLIVFIVLGLPSAGGTVPIEATPRAMEWLSTFEPMHQIFIAVRAILYYDARANSGLAQGVWMALLGLLIGLVIGLAATSFYDRKGLERRSVSTAGK
ncbi:YhgE/Pip domain-containing protein [Nocardia sp. NPDC058379]|uniref:YhgE/Pip domain-containing protein n=1 Tax=unclassified Nocardia TaxID=2637762 RepID=UPI003666A6B2